MLPLSFFRSLVASLGCCEWEEFTAEVNPEDVVTRGPEFLRGLKELGVDRVSMGVQSFDDRVLGWMNRRHNSATALRAFSMLRECGFGNISIDLIFGFPLPEGCGGLWRETLETAIGLHPEHISAYQLSVEPDSALEKMLSDGRFCEASQEECAGAYSLLCGMLSDAGYEHYEVSNFCLPGRRALHNSGYWKHVPYVGLGPAAHSFDGRVRSWNDADLSAYCSSRRGGNETLTDCQYAIEEIMLGLRTSDGVDANYLRGHCDSGIIAKFVEQGRLSESDGRIRIPEDHMFVSDNIITQLI